MTNQNTKSSLEDLIQRVRLIAFDFDGVFTDNMVYVFEDGREAVRCFRSDGIGLQKLKKLGIETVIISTEANPVVSARARKLKIRCIQDCQDKRAVLADIAREKNITLSDDVIASVKTSGLIGDKFIKLSPGGSDDILEPEDTITETESALDIEELISKYAFGEAK